MTSLGGVLYPALLLHVQALLGVLGAGAPCWADSFLQAAPESEAPSPSAAPLLPQAQTCLAI